MKKKAKLSLPAKSDLLGKSEILKQYNRAKKEEAQYGQQIHILLHACLSVCLANAFCHWLNFIEENEEYDVGK